MKKVIFSILILASVFLTACDVKDDYINGENDKKCGECPQFVSPSPDFCEGGIIIPGGVDECGCKMPPTCQKDQIDFCGTSTYGECNTNLDCIKDGCSSQICRSINEEPLTTTCEYKECYNPELYNLNCKCANNECQWKEQSDENLIDPVISCNIDDDCTVSSTSNDPNLKKYTLIGKKGYGLSAENIEIACISKTYFENNKEEYILETLQIWTGSESYCGCKQNQCKEIVYGINPP